MFDVVCIYDTKTIAQVVLLGNRAIAAMSVWGSIGSWPFDGGHSSHLTDSYLNALGFKYM